MGMNRLASTGEVILISALLCVSAAGQEADLPGSVDSVEIIGDSARTLNSTGLLSDGKIASSVPRLESRSPTGALLRSMAFPGWGQFYNRKYIKALVVMAGEGYCIVQAARNWDLADQAIDLFVDEDNSYLRQKYYYAYDFYQDRRNLFLWLSGLAIFLSMIDAYVDAHLANFDIDITPPFEEQGGSAVSLRISYRF